MPVAFDHIAIAAPRIEAAPAFLVGELGGRSGFGGSDGEYRWWHWDYANGGRLEVIEPDGSPGGFVHRFLDRNGPGIHHVTFYVPSLRASCERAESFGYGIVGYRDSDSQWSEAFLHPKQAMGIVVQMVESHHDADHEHEHEHDYEATPPFEEPAVSPPPVRLVGVRLRTSDRGRAVRQWAELLEAELEETPGELRFSWPGSGMRVVVGLEHGAADASVAIELRSERSLLLPEGPHPLLGAEFRQLP